MKKILKICLACFLVAGLAGCGSSEEKAAKSVVSDYLDYLQDRNFTEAAKMTGDTYDTSHDGDEIYKRKVALMLDRLDYEISDVSINGNDGVITVELSNIHYTNFLESSKMKLEANTENFSELSNEDKELKLIELMEAELPNADVVTQSVSAYVYKDGDTWKLSKSNATFFKAVNGE